MFVKVFRTLVFTLLSFFTLSISNSFAQVDSIKVKAEMLMGLSSKGYLPMWIGANRYGVINDHRTDGFIRAGAQVPIFKSKHFSLQSGLDFIGRPSDSGTYVHQGYLKAKLFFFEFRAGREEETIGIHDPTLSSGSLALSRNARPMPKLMISVPEYTPVPLTFGYLHFKGLFSHGWFEKDRFIQSPYLHEKNFYLKLGGKLPVNLHAGFVHYAVWGGNHQKLGPLPSRFKDYTRVIFGKDADAGYEGSTGLGGEVINALGNHLGIYDFGLEIKIKDFKVLTYHQTPWEDMSGLKLFRNKDRLLGTSIRRDKPGIVTGFLYEYLHTKFQSGPGTPDPLKGREEMGKVYRHGGRDDYYNNYLYRTGWVYHDRVMGTPMFTTTSRAMHYFGEINDYNVNIVNNRVVAHHFGLEGQLGKNVSYRTLATYTRNFGTYAGINGGRYQWGSLDPAFTSQPYPFKPALDQFYFMVETVTELPFASGLQLLTTLGYDTGQMTKNFGGLLGLRWNGMMLPKKMEN